MIVPYRPEESQEFYDEYYNNQGGYGISVYQGRSVMPPTSVMSGYGIGSVFSGLLRAAVPILKRTALNAGKRLFKSGLGIAGDVMRGQNAKQSASKRLKTVGSNVLADLADSIKTPSQAGINDHNQRVAAMLDFAPQASTPPQPEATSRPEPSTRTPAEQTAPPAAPVFEKAEPQPAAAPPVAAAPVVAPPEVLQRVEPSYSAKAVKGLDNPVITLRVLVDQQGKIARVLVEEGIPGSELEGAAISAVLRWRFRPATEDGVPVKAWTNVRFVFQN